MKIAAHARSRALRAALAVTALAGCSSSIEPTADAEVRSDAAACPERNPTSEECCTEAGRHWVGYCCPESFGSAEECCAAQGGVFVSDSSCVVPGPFVPPAMA